MKRKRPDPYRHLGLVIAAESSRTRKSAVRLWDGAYGKSKCTGARQGLVMTLSQLAEAMGI